MKKGFGGSLTAGRGVLFLILGIALGSPAISQAQSNSKEKRIDDVWQNEEVIRRVIRPTVYLDGGGNTIGSGVIIKSEFNQKERKYKNFVLTAHHVVRNALGEKRNNKGKIEDNRMFVEIKGEDGLNRDKYESTHIFPKTLNEIIQRHFGRTVMVGHNKEKMALHKFGKKHDLALLVFNSDREIKDVARLPREMFLERIGPTTQIRLVGFPMGVGPMSTFGELASLMEIDGSQYRLISAEGTGGNSGGGIFTSRGNYLVGIFSKMFKSKSVYSPMKVNGGLMVRMKTVHQYLIKSGHGRLIPGWLPKEEAPKFMAKLP